MIKKKILIHSLIFSPDGVSTAYLYNDIALAFQKKGYDVVVVDNLCNSSQESLKRVAEIVGKEIPFYEADIRDAKAMNDIFAKEEYNKTLEFLLRDSAKNYLSEIE